MKQGKNGIDRIGHMVYQNFIILQMWNVFLALICVCIYSFYSSWRGRGPSRCSAPQSFQRSSPRCRPHGGFHFSAIRKSSIIWTPPIVAILLWCPDVSSSHAAVSFFFPESLRSVREDSNVVMLSCLTNFLTNTEEAGASVLFRVNPVLR